MPSLLLRLSDNQPHTEKDEVLTEEANNWLLSEIKMLFSSRSRSNHLEAIQLVNASILNYGINELASQEDELHSKKMVIENNIINTLKRFEPRLYAVSVTAMAHNDSNFFFEINAAHNGVPVKISLSWDDYTGKFSFDE